MTKQEAIDYLLDPIGKGIETHDEAVRMAVNALQKQIPEKPMISIDAFNSNLRYLYCSCGAFIGGWNKRVRTIDMYNKTNAHICAQCGRAIDCSIERLENDD